MPDEKKIADEVMSDEELDQVAGGSCYEMADDSRFLNSLNGSTDRYCATNIFFSDLGTGLSPKHNEIKNAWAALGIIAQTNSGYRCNNKYYLDGQEITQEQARQHAMEVTGHHMTEKDWNW